MADDGGRDDRRVLPAVTTVVLDNQSHNIKTCRRRLLMANPQSS